MTSSAPLERLPAPLRRYILHFEASIEDAVVALAAELPPAARVLDAGAGEGRYARFFTHARYIGIDLAVGDASWNYSGLDALADLAALPVRDASFAACLNIVTLEHVCDPELVLREIHRVLAPGATLLLIVPHEWEVHQAPYDYFRFTRHGVELLLRRAGFDQFTIRPVGGYFRLLARRLLNGLQFFMRGWRAIALFPAALLLVPPAMVIPLFDFLDQERNFTLGYICKAKKRT
ncbi:MAG: class I SAM-dependent methyltransferase [Bryobacteraceae bacterium]